MPFFSVTVKSFPLPLIRSHTLHSNFLLFCARRIALPTRGASSYIERVSNLCLSHSHSHSQGGRNFVHDPGTWMSDDENEEDRSLDLLVRFVQNVFKKVSKRARKALQSVLPFPISTHLLGFSVNGVLVLAFLWILKAFLEVMQAVIVTMCHQVVCTLGSVVFVSILLIRGIWSGVSFLQESQHRKLEELDVEHNAWNGAQPVT